MHPQMADVCLCVCAGPIDFRHAFLDMTGIDVREGPNTRAGRTCPAAMGFSFAAGTTDGTHVWCFHLQSPVPAQHCTVPYHTVPYRTACMYSSCAS